MRNSLLRALSALAAAGLFACSPSMRVAPELKAPETAEAVERGRYLADHVLGCIDCHSPRDMEQPGGPPLEGKAYSGGWILDERFSQDGEPLPGRLQPPNITQHPEDGIGAWSDGEIARAIREGVDRDGDALFPMMPYLDYKQLSDEEVLAVIAYLRTIEPVANKTVERELDFPLGMIVNFIPEPLEGPVSAPDVTDAVQRGKRLVSLSGCNHCHSPSEQGTPIEGLEYSGGVVMSAPHIPAIGTAVSSNISPDEETGIGKVTEEEFLAMMREGKGKDGRTMNPMMPWVVYQGMTEQDLKDMYAYLMSVPPIKKDVYAELAKYSRE